MFLKRIIKEKRNEKNEIGFPHWPVELLLEA